MNLNNIFSLRWVLMVGVIAAIATGCGGGGGGDDDDDDDDAVGTNRLSLAYPDDLAISSITAATSATQGLQQALASGGLSAQTVTSKPPEEKQEDLGQLLKPPDEATFNQQMGEFKNEVDYTAFQVPPADCYGPELFYDNHPNGADGAPSNDMATGQPHLNPSLPTGDLGIWTETEASTGEACAAAKLTNIIGQFEGMANVATKTVAMTLGAANLKGVVTELPARDQQEDMTAPANEALDENSVPMDMTTATLTQETEETDEGFPVLTTNNEATVTVGGNQQATIDITLQHIPEVDADTLAQALTLGQTVEDETYCGRLTQKILTPQMDTECIRIEYCKDSETSLTYHLRKATYQLEDVECGSIDPASGWDGNYYYTICNLDPTTGAGSCAQAWQAGPGDDSTRVLNVNLNADGSGCGYFGYGPAVTENGVGQITKMICNWAGPGNNHQGTQKVQRQCFTRDANGKYISDAATLAITYAPTLSCDKAAADMFVYSLTDADPLDGSGAGGSPADADVNDTLIDLAAMDFTVPALPQVDLP